MGGGGKAKEAEEQWSVPCPSPLSVPTIHCLSLCCEEKDSSWAEMQDFQGATSILSSKTAHYAPLVGGQNALSIPRKY